MLYSGKVAVVMCSKTFTHDFTVVRKFQTWRNWKKRERKETPDTSRQWVRWNKNGALDIENCNARKLGSQIICICRDGEHRFWHSFDRKHRMSMAVKSRMSVDLSSSAMIKRAPPAMTMLRQREHYERMPWRTHYVKSCNIRRLQKCMRKHAVPAYATRLSLVVSCSL